MKMTLLLAGLFCMVEVMAGEPLPKQERPPFRPEHEFYIGAGIFPYPAQDEEDDMYMLSDWKYYSPIHFEGDIYRGAKFTTGAYFAGYSYRIKRWLNIGVSMSYTAYHRKIYEYYTDREVGKERNRYLGVIPRIRFIWLDRKWIRMYSGAGLGMTLKWHKHRSSRENSNKLSALVTPTVTLVGLSMGTKSWFVFMEGGISDHGTVSAGVGYRLHSKQSK